MGISPATTHHGVHVLAEIAVHEQLQHDCSKYNRDAVVDYIVKIKRSKDEKPERSHHLAENRVSERRIDDVYEFNELQVFLGEFLDILVKFSQLFSKLAENFELGYAVERNHHVKHVHCCISRIERIQVWEETLELW